MRATISRPDLLRVPEVTLLFWVLKILTTGVGETTSDYLVRAFDPVIVVVIAGALLAVCVAVQFRAGRYVPWRYWLLVTMIAIAGTMAADVTHIVFLVPYLNSTIAFALVLAAIFVVWWRVERTLSIHSISTTRREVFYWATVSATFALGTAFGDLTATTFGLGYLGSGILFSVLFAIPAIGYRFGIPATLAFWWAYILTRPLGASFADWLAVSHARGGLDIGPLVVSAIGGTLMLIGVVYLQLQERRRTRNGRQPSDALEFS